MPVAINQNWNVLSFFYKADTYTMPHTIGLKKIFFFMNALLINLNMIQSMKGCCFCVVYIPQPQPDKEWLWLHNMHTTLKYLMLKFPMYNKKAPVFGSACSNKVQSDVNMCCMTYSGVKESQTSESASVLHLFLHY